MPAGDRDDPDNFNPPEIPILVHCMHCGEEFDSWKIEFREGQGPAGYVGAWCCPTPGCGGVGFCFDLWPVDPDWTNENGDKVCFFDDGDEEEDEGEEDGGIAEWSEEEEPEDDAEYDPAEPQWQDSHPFGGFKTEAEREAFDKSWENMTGDIPPDDASIPPAANEPRRRRDEDDFLNEDDIPF